MRQTQKYRSACYILTFPHDTQDTLYKELNRLGWYWNAKNQEWIRDDRLADPPMEGIKIRLWTNEDEASEFADLIKQALQEYGLRLVDFSKIYPCRPPKQNEARIYLHFVKNR